MRTFYYYPSPGVHSDIYLSVATYSHEIVPTSCTTGTLTNGAQVEYPAAFLAIYRGNTLVSQKQYLDQT